MNLTAPHHPYIATTRFPAYDPADSPGPVPSVIEHLRPPAPGEPPRPDSVDVELARYLVVLVTPDTAEVLGHDRSDAGFMLYKDNHYDTYVAHLTQAAECIARECGFPVALVEHHSDLSYWTAHELGPADDT